MKMLRLDNREVVVRFPTGKKYVHLIFHAFRWVVGPRTHTPIQLVLMRYLPEPVGIIQRDLPTYTFLTLTQ